MRRILLLTLDFPPRTGGVATYLHAFAMHVRDRVRVVAPAEPGDAMDASAPYPIERYPLLRRWMNPRWLSAIWYLVTRGADYDVVVVSHVLPLGTACWVAGYLTKRPYIVTVHGMDVGLGAQRPRKRWIMARALREAELVIANSQALEAEVRRDYGLEKTVTVYPCLSADQVRAPATPESGNEVRLLTVSRLVPRKGHLRVLDALALLYKRERLGNIRYDILGEGTMRKEIEERVRALGLEKIVRVHEDLSDANRDELYRHASLFVMPTVVDAADREGFGLVYVEAAERGVPSIATRQPGVDEAVVDGETGVLVPDGDVEALAEAIHRLATDATERRRLGENARARAISTFTCDVQFSRLDPLL